jgi:hypothetical protein
MRAFSKLTFIDTVLIGICLLAPGCGEPGNKHGALPISGAVTVDGEPLKSGYLVFEPKSGQPTQSGGMIRDGKFDVPAKNGAAPGMYSVAIFAEGEAPATTAAPGTPEYEAATARARGNPIPSRYNFNSELTAEVTSSGENVFSFNLNTK